MKIEKSCINRNCLRCIIRQNSSFSWYSHMEFKRNIFKFFDWLFSYTCQSIYNTFLHRASE